MRKGKAVFTALCVILAYLGMAGVSSAAEKTYTNSIGMEFVLIPAGSFMMGTPPDFEKSGRDKRPLHKATISKPFYLGKYEVTQAQWEVVMGSNPSKFQGQNNPVERVSWRDAQEFIKRLNAREGHKRYRLPTEAEWEYAARAGTSNVYFFGNDRKDLSRYAWYEGNSKGTTHPAGRKPANAWGLHDIHGNVREWVQDWYEEKYYANSPGIDPKGPAKGSHRVNRGGSWYDYAEVCRTGYRGGDAPEDRDNGVGLRLALSVSKAAPRKAVP